MRIAMFSDNFYPEMSGLSDSIMTTARELGRLGHFVEFYVPRYTKKEFDMINVPEQEINLGKNVSVVRMPSIGAKAGTGQGRAAIPNFSTLFRIKKFNPDLLHSHLFFGSGLQALWASWYLKKPIIGTNHTALHEEMFAPYAPLQSQAIARFVIRYAVWFYNHCEFITAPSKIVVEVMKEKGFRKDGFAVSNPINTQVFINKPKENLLTVVHAGRLATERKIDVVLHAFQMVKNELPKAKLLIAGKGAAEPELRALTKKLGLEKDIIFLGFLSQEQLSDAYNASDIFVNMSTNDTQSMVMMQAMACGLPVMITKGGGPSEYVSEDCGYLIDPGNSAQLAQDLSALLKNPVKRVEMGNAAMRSVQEFSTPLIAKKWEKIYRSVIQKYRTGNLQITQ